MTAKHVVVDPVTDKPRDNNMLIFLNTKSGKPQARSLDHIKKDLSFKWIFHQEKQVDVAIIPFPVDPENDDIKTIPNSIFLSSDQLYEVYYVFFFRVSTWHNNRAKNIAYVQKWNNKFDERRQYVLH
ncbi:MAG: hypothetical protein WCF23_04985 [Candidatus Nitrosopolaris sp.]